MEIYNIVEAKTTTDAIYKLQKLNLIWIKLVPKISKCCLINETPFEVHMEK